MNASPAGLLGLAGCGGLQLHGIVAFTGLLHPAQGRVGTADQLDLEERVGGQVGEKKNGLETKKEQIP